MRVVNPRRVRAAAFPLAFAYVNPPLVFAFTQKRLIVFPQRRKSLDYQIVGFFKRELAALLHDVGKPFCMLRDGNAHEHPVEGVRLATDILHRLKAPKKETQKILFLIQWHMYDFNCQTKESKLRRFFVCNANRLDDLLALKQADFSACTDDFSPAPTCVRWKALLKRMENENVPFSLKTLAIKGDDLLTLGIAPARIATLLQRLLTHTAVEPKDNKKEKLLRLALVFEKELF